MSEGLRSPTTAARTPPHLQVADFGGLWASANTEQEQELRRLVGALLPELTRSPLEQHRKREPGADVLRSNDVAEQAWSVYGDADEEALPDAFSEEFANVMLGTRTERCETTGTA